MVAHDLDLLFQSVHVAYMKVFIFFNTYFAKKCFIECPVKFDVYILNHPKPGTFCQIEFVKCNKFSQDDNFVLGKRIRGPDSAALMNGLQISSAGDMFKDLAWKHQKDIIVHGNVSVLPTKVLHFLYFSDVLNKINGEGRKLNPFTARDRFDGLSTLKK